MEPNRVGSGPNDTMMGSRFGSLRLSRAGLPPVRSLGEALAGSSGLSGFNYLNMWTQDSIFGSFDV